MKGYELVKAIEEAREQFLRFDNTPQSHAEHAESKAAVVALNKFVKVYTYTLHGKQYRFFGVRQEVQSQIDYTELRSKISHELRLNESTGFSQIIGDSVVFSQAGTEYGRRFLAERLNKELKDDIILYGLTGNAKNKTLLDTNQLVNEWIDDPHYPERAKWVIANIVDFDTVKAIQEWSSQIAENVRHFYLVYRANSPSVRFGDDVVSSDGLTNHQVICLEGGLQALKQASHLLQQGVAMAALTNLRNLMNPLQRDPDTHLSFISAAELITVLQLTAAKESVNQDAIEAALQQYLSQRALYAKSKGESNTKQALWEAAKKLLVEKEVWQHLPSLVQLFTAADSTELQTLPTNVNSLSPFFSPAKNTQALASSMEQAEISLRDNKQCLTHS